MCSYMLAKFTILLLFCNLIVITSKKLTIPDDKKSLKLSECQRCKLLSDSFNYWLDKTSRGKFEGGDAAWEETKLKSYSRSEIRLVEIQEGLCSELSRHKDYCYALSEEVEQPLEKWWFEEDPSGSDLYTWLCIDMLQHCCPESHYGKLCDPCPRNKDNNVCSTNGKCDGDGTRKGNGSCICGKGYMGTLCEKCASNYFRGSNGICEACHVSCENCKGEGSSECTACKSGWSFDNGICIDINECIDTTLCKIHQYCENREGSYVCRKCEESCGTCLGPGASNCTTCRPDYTLWSGMCVDNKLKDTIIKNALQKLLLYIGLILISFYILRKSKTLASLVIVVIAVYIYLAESNMTMSSFLVFYNLANIS